MAERIVVPYATETLTVQATAVPLTLSVYDTGEIRGAIKAVIGPTEDASIRWWSNGDTPVATSSGHLVPEGTIIELTDGDIKKFLAVRDGSTDAVLQVSYYRAA